MTDAKVLQQFPTRGIQRNMENKMCVAAPAFSILILHCIKKLLAKSSFIANRALFNSGRGVSFGGVNSESCIPTPGKLQKTSGGEI